MRMRNLLSCLLIFISFGTLAQTYSNNREKFVKQFQKSLTEYGKGEFHDFAKKEFPVLLLETSDFPDNYFNKMVSTCNLLESKRLKPYPEIYNYVYSVSAFVQNKQPSSSYEAWHQSIDKLLDSRTVKKFTNFIDFSAGFFSEDMLSSSSSFDWFYLDGNYEFIYDKKGPQVKFNGGDLVCRVRSSAVRTRGDILDSVNVIKTEGTYDPVLKKWYGNGGKITWERVGLAPGSTFANLESSYQLSLKKSVVRVDSVSLTTPYFDEPIKGSLTDRAFKTRSEGEKVFPQFMSFNTNLLIENIVDGVDYVGGFQMKGGDFLGTGTTGKPAHIVLKQDGRTFIKAFSPEIVVEEGKVRIPRAQVSLYFESGDSLYHPGANFTYDLDKKSVSLARSNVGVGRAAFQDSYHQLDIIVAKVLWEVGSNNLSFTYEFGTSQEQRVARFESKSFFDERLYDQLQGLSSVHPLVALANYSYKYDEEVMSEGKAASAIGMSVEQAKSVLIELSNLGFITYNTEAKVVRINQKLITFVEAKAGERDYDNLIFVSDQRPKKHKALQGKTKQEIEQDPYLRFLDSVYTATNVARMKMSEYATLDMSTMNLNIQAIDDISISMNKNVVVLPNGNEVSVRKNRDFNFSGWMYAGKLEVNTVAANFVYDDFKIKVLDSKESFFRVTPLKRDHGDRRIVMKSQIHGIVGELRIDDPKNKSGVNADYSNYPIIKSTSACKVFYNDEDIFRGVYDSTRFYYSMDPFEMDSLSNFKEYQVRFDGELTSAGIFPKFRQQIRIMPDYSFGFSTKAPQGGYTFYGTKAKYENKIVLSNNGLQGAGTINFINSTSISKGLSFLPDSTVGVANFVNRASETGVQFPPVKSEEAYITYVPHDNVLKARSTPQNDLDFFDSEAALRGMLQIRPEGMTGNGLMTFERATLISDGFKYKRWDIDADTSSFSLKNDDTNPEEEALSFKTDNVNSHISFKDRMGEFNSNQGESEVFFPVNQYMCKMDKFNWFMDDYEIEMERQAQKDIAINQGVDLKGPNFFSTHPKQDSLQFSAPKAKFNVRLKTIFCNEVEYVDIADARIYPDSMKLTIRKKAKIDKLKDAEIVANYVTKYHKFDQAEVEIKARRDYKASGRYPYYDLDSNVYYIMMDNIRPDDTYQTTASGKIAQEDDFKLSDQFDYYGEASIRASNPTILFSGATRINHDCAKFDRNWMAFTSEIDPKNIQIPVDKDMKNLEGGSISAGIVWRDSPSTDSLGLYPTFLSALVDAKDPIVMTASGYLQFNDAAKEFQIASKEKLINRAEKGNFIALHTESCSMNGDGVISLGTDFGAVKVDAVGVVNYNQTSGETSMNITARFDMKLDKGLMQDAAKRIAEVEGLKPMDFNSTTLEQAVLEWNDQKTADEFKSKYVIDGVVKKVPSGLNTAFTITGLRLSSFDDGLQTKGLITNTQSAVLVNMYGEPVMKYVPFRAFFQQIYSGAGGDKFTTLIDIPGGRDYLFDYRMVKKDGELKIYSGDSAFTEAMNAMKEDKRKSKNFSYTPTSSSIFRTKLFELFGE